MRRYLKMIFFLFCSIVAGGLMMIGAYHIPVEWMKENVQESAVILRQEGMYPSLVKGYSYTTLDNFTDTLMLNVATCEVEESTVYKAMMIPHTYYDGIDWLEKVIEDTEEIEKQEVLYYQRYWHGYLVILKPLLTIFSYQDIRVINGFMQYILLSIVCILLYKKLDIRYMFAFVATVFFLNPASISLSMQFSSVYYITLLCMIILLTQNKELEKKEERYELLFMGTGIMVVYFDLLTYPIVALGIPLVTYLSLNVENLKRPMLSTVKLSVAWFLGYGGMWAGKWCMCTLLTRYNTFRNAFESVKARSSGNVVDAMISNLSVWYNKSTVLICILIFVIGIVGLFLNRCRVNKRILPLVCVGFYPFIWYAILKNHSTVHGFFTYRNLTVLMFSYLCIVIKCMGKNVGRNLEIKY